jgi:hypothetical protein
MPGLLVRKIFNETIDTTAKAFFRTVSVPHHETLSFMGVDAKGAILEHPTALSEVREAGRKLVVV